MNLQTAQRLLEYRKNAGLSQEELAERIGVSRQAVSKWERGEASPDTDNLIALSEVFGVTLDELIKGKTDRGEVNDPEPGKETVHISFKDGIEVNDPKRGEKVHVDWKGIHVESPANHVHVDKHGVYVKNEHGEIVKHERTKAHSLFIKFPYPVLAAMAYLYFGAFDVCGGWATGWLVFLTIPLYYTLVSAIFNRNASHFAYPVLVTLVYLYLGFEQTLWHPAWIIFLTVPFYYFVCEFVKKMMQHME